jgi:TM2 domain-containing membrane protein YozV
MKSTGVAYLWWLFFGGLGAHKFYLGRPGLGVLYACTLGLLFMGILWDLFTLPSQVRAANERLVSDARKYLGSGSAPNTTGGAMAFIFKISLAMLFGFVVMAAFVAPKYNDTPATAATTASPVAKAPQSKADVHVVNFNCSRAYGFTTVDGEIRNISNSPISNLMIVASHYASDGTFIRSDSGMVEYNPLMPGQTSPFKAVGTDNPMISNCKVGFKRMFGGAVQAEQ